MKDYLKAYLAGQGGKELPPHTRDGEVPQVPEAPAGAQGEAFGTYGTGQRVESPENLPIDLDIQPATTPINDPEIRWRVEAMLSQIPDRGPLPFLVAREAIEQQTGCCFSCGDPLKQGDAYRCAACSRAANVALDLCQALKR